jgi:hypothetical protein
MRILSCVTPDHLVIHINLDAIIAYQLDYSTTTRGTRVWLSGGEASGLLLLIEPDDLGELLVRRESYSRTR